MRHDWRDVYRRMSTDELRYVYLALCIDQTFATREESREFSRGRMEHIVALLIERGAPVCDDYKPDHNGECLNCDEPLDVHPLFWRKFDVIS